MICHIFLYDKWYFPENKQLCIKNITDLVGKLEFHLTHQEGESEMSLLLFSTFLLILLSIFSCESAMLQEEKLILVPPLKKLLNYTYKKKMLNLIHLVILHTSNAKEWPFIFSFLAGFDSNPLNLGFFKVYCLLLDSWSWNW